MRNYLVNIFPWLTPAWYLLRALLASFGALCLYLGMFYYGIAKEVITSGLFVVSWAITFALQAILLGFTFKLWIMNVPSGGVADKESTIPTGETWVDPETDNVFYDPITTLKDLKKAVKTSEEWKTEAGKYNKMKGLEWMKVRTFCLSQAKKTRIRVQGNQVTF